MTYKDAWEKYCTIKQWKESGNHVDWQYEIENNVLYLYFQGSDEFIDWQRDLMCWPKKNYTKWYHYGFYKSYHEVSHAISLLPKQIYDKKMKWIIIGYSSGGVLAITFAEIVSIFVDVDCFTFAAPRFSWVKKEKDCANITNVRLDNDIVPKLFSILGYRKNPGTDMILKSPCKSCITSHLPEAYTRSMIEKII